MIELQRCETADLIQEATDAISNIRISIDNEIERVSTADLLKPDVSLLIEESTTISSGGQGDTVIEKPPDCREDSLSAFIGE